jgi:hypothetical protein
MKLLLPTTLLFLGISLSAQMPGMMTMQSAGSDGTTLGANETLAYNGIALGNRVKMRGYVDFYYKYEDTGATDTADYTTASDVDFLFDLSPVTGEVHLAASTTSIDLEQAFGRYSLNNSFNLTFGRQLTALGYEADEAPGLYAVSNAYVTSLVSTQLRRNYVNGIRANFNNGQFGFTFGMHDAYWGVQDDLNDHFAIDIAASVMILPGLEARIGFAHEEHDQVGGDDDINQFNAWISYNPGDLTLAFEFDTFDIYGNDLWDIMLLANYQFVDWFGATIRYSHEDLDVAGVGDTEADRISFALLFTLTSNLYFNFEYSHTELEVAGGDSDIDEVYLEALLTF